MKIIILLFLISCGSIEGDEEQLSSSSIQPSAVKKQPPQQGSRSDRIQKIFDNISNQSNIQEFFKYNGDGNVNTQDFIISKPQSVLVFYYHQTSRAPFVIVNLRNSSTNRTVAHGLVSEANKEKNFIKTTVRVKPGKYYFEIMASNMEYWLSIMQEK